MAGRDPDSCEAPCEPPCEPPALGPRFRVIKTLARGAAGTTVEALDCERRRRVAVTMPRPIPGSAGASPAAVRAFKRRFRMVRDVHHPNLPAPGELLVHDRCWFFTLELIDGTALFDFLGEDTRPGAQETRLREAFGQLACAIDALHANGVQHLDVERRSVVVTAERRVVLADLGCALIAPGDASARPADDWRALGELLARALVRTRADISRELRLLCADLLLDDAARRPTGEQVIGRLGWLQARLRRAPAAPLPADWSHELCRLSDGVTAAARGRPGLALVLGDAQRGRRRFVDKFVRSLADREQVVVAGRAHEREPVPLNAFDAILDELADRFALPGIPVPPWSPGAAAQALHASLASAGRPIVLIVDDAELADEASWAFAAELLGRSAPLLLVLCMAATGRALARARALAESQAATDGFCGRVTIADR